MGEDPLELVGHQRNKTSSFSGTLFSVCFAMSPIIPKALRNIHVYGSTGKLTVGI